MSTDIANLPVADLIERLKSNHEQKYDVVVNAARLSAEQGRIVIADGDTILRADGVESTDVHLDPSRVFDEGVAHRFGIPVRYVRTMRDGHPDLWDANVNYWLGEDPSRKFLVRGFKSEGVDEIGIGRALLSDRYRPFDDLDALMAVLSGVRNSGVNVEVSTADLTERRMYVRFDAPDVAAHAEWLLDGYRSPFQGSGHGGETAERPRVVNAGFVVKNSETGGGAFSIVPRLRVQICDNGMQVDKDLFREVHVGGTLDEGIIDWSEGTTRKMVELISAKTSDLVTTVLSQEYLDRQLEQLRDLRDAEIADPVGTIERVGKQLKFTEAEQADILGCFVKSGDVSPFGVTQAVTAACQGWQPDRRDEAEGIAIDAGRRALVLASA